MNYEIAKTPTKKKFSLIVFMIIFSLVFWLLLMSKPFLFLYSYDILYNILCIVQYIIIACIIYCFIKSLLFILAQRTQGKNNHMILKIFSLVVILACNLFLWNILELNANNLQISGYFSISNKYSQDDKYYISVYNEDTPTNISVDAETYKALIADPKVSYGIEYRTTHLSSKGVLEKSIDANHFIDNRD